jgi:Putative beta-lactamase-inhibitor-like, PepSY-like
MFENNSKSSELLIRFDYPLFFTKIFLMKKIVSVCVLACITITLFAQHKNATVPAGIKSAFEKDFKGSTNVKWEKEGNEYESSFKMNGKTMSANYDVNAVLKETEEEIKVSELPASVTAYVKEHYKGSAIKEAAKITKPGGIVNYEASVNKTDLIFDSQGKFLEKE